MNFKFELFMLLKLIYKIAARTKTRAFLFCQTFALKKNRTKTCAAGGFRDIIFHFKWQTWNRSLLPHRPDQLPCSRWLNVKKIGSAANWFCVYRVWIWHEPRTSAGDGFCSESCSIVHAIISGKLRLIGTLTKKVQIKVYTLGLIF